MVTFSKPIIEDVPARVLVEKKDELENLIVIFKSKIDNNELPKANEIVRDQVSGSRNKIKRPPNSNLIYTNQLGKNGLLDIIRKFCEEYGINKQKMVPISKKVSKTLWNKLSPVHQKFFEELALKVSKEHKLLHPNYKYKPERKKKKTITYKYYDHENSKKPLKPNTDLPPSNHHVENPSADNVQHEGLSSVDSSPNPYEEPLEPPTFIDYDLSEYFGEGLLNIVEINYDFNSF